MRTQCPHSQQLCGHSARTVNNYVDTVTAHCTVNNYAHTVPAQSTICGHSARTVNNYADTQFSRTYNLHRNIFFCIYCNLLSYDFFEQKEGRKLQETLRYRPPLLHSLRYGESTVGRKRPPAVLRRRVGPTLRKEDISDSTLAIYCTVHSIIYLWCTRMQTRN